ncbi:MAG: cell division protein FtsZ [Bacteroidota bacterium]
MENSSYSFDLPKHHKSIIKVIGVGGGGSNAVTHMFAQGIKDVEFVICNTDSQALLSSTVNNRLQIGAHLTEGLGAGANPEKGKNAALESKEDIRDLLNEDTKMIFITAGMGGGTGTGAAPVIAQVARDLGILTVGIVTMPFAFEGKKKMAQAEAGLEELKRNCDTVLIILNDKLREVYGNLSISNAFAQADNVLTTAAKGIAEIITVPGYVNVDFEDVKTVMMESGAAVMGSATTDGDRRAIRAAEEAISSPLLNNKNIHGAQKILLSIMSGEVAELQMDELTEITEFIQEIAGFEAEMIFGHGVDENLGESIRVTVIATGFEENKFSPPKIDNSRRVFDLESSQQISLFKEEQKASTQPEPTNEEVTLDESESYSFERSEPEETEIEEVNEADKVLLSLEDEYEIEERKPAREEETSHSFSWDVKAEMEDKKKELEEQSKERVRKLQGLSSHNSFDSGDFKNKLEVPAYLRKKVQFQDVPHSSERNISRYNLNDDNQILGNNKFLHDNVD